MTLQADRDVLQELASQVTEGVIVEIGSKNGLSAQAIASVAKVPLYCIDLWDLSPAKDNRPEIHLNTDEQFREAVKGLNVIPVKGLSREIAKVWDKPIGMLFIDGDHSYQGFKGDYNGFSPHVIEGGIIAIHDRHYTGVDKGIKELGYTDWQEAGHSIITRINRGE
jgi:predicted O-methyltransferase YrrM